MANSNGAAVVIDKRTSVAAGLVITIVATIASLGTTAAAAAWYLSGERTGALTQIGANQQDIIEIKANVEQIKASVHRIEVFLGTQLEP